MESKGNLQDHEFQFVVAIDYGTSYCAFSCGTIEQDSKNFTVWMPDGRISKPWPNRVKVDENGDLLEFGMKFVPHSSEEKVYYVDNVKLQLSPENKLEDEAEEPYCKDVSGTKRWPASKIIALCLKWISDEALKHLQSRYQDDVVEKSKILWCLTIPAIWDDRGKSVMQEAAIQAGLTDASLVNLELALEPEAALCGILVANKHYKLKKDDVIIVIDAGSGTIDFAVEKLIDEKLGKCASETFTPTARILGSRNVDEKMFQLLSDALGDEFQTLLQEDCMLKSILIDSFKQVKDLSNELDLLLWHLPAVIFGNDPRRREILERRLASWSLPGFKYSRNCITIQNEGLRTLLKDCLDGTNTELDNIIQSLQLQEAVFVLVGGLSTCKVFKTCLTEWLAAKGIRSRMISSSNPSCSVVSGAVHYAHMPLMITERVSAMGYGITFFDPNFNDAELKKYGQAFYGRDYVKRFQYLVEPKKKIICSQDIDVQREFLPAFEGQKEITFVLYSTAHDDVKYGNDPRLLKVGEMKVPYTNKTTWMWKQLGYKDSAVKIRVKFGKTVLCAIAELDGVEVRQPLRMKWRC
jgi:hypothetical protein